jgi:molybdopterin-containing oxidoreductase family membrane subunit
VSAPQTPPELTARQITDDLTAPIFRLPSLQWVGGFLTAAGLAGLFGLAILAYCVEGYGIFGVDNTVNWGNDIGSYVFWIGIAVAGTLVSSVLLLFRQRWRTGVNRATEAMTVFAINIAGIYPLIHTGRPWVDYWLLPLPNDLSLWEQFKSPIVWDVFAITGYATTSVLFFYLGLIPDFAAVRDRCPDTRFGRLQRLLYSALSLGWKGTASDWRHYERAYTQFAWVATPLVVGMHSTIATLLAVSLVPGWHASVFPPYFVSGAIFGGLAMAMLLLIPLRSAFSLERYITVDHLERLAKIMLTVGMIVLYVYVTEFFTAWYSESAAEQGQYWYRLTGEHKAFFWTMILCNVVSIQLLWFRSLRRNLGVLLLVAFMVNAGMWLERYNIVVLSLERDHLPSKWTAYGFTAWDYIILSGSFGLFFTQFLLFCRVAPVVSIAEIKATLLRRGRHGSAQEASHG